MSKNFADKHEEILIFLLKKHAEDKNFFFTPRTRNNSDRLNKGFWFIGNNDYLDVSFWKGRDDNEKVHNIGFVITPTGDSYIEVNAQKPQNRLEFLHLLMNKLGGGFEKKGNKNKWYRKYPNQDYLENLGDFIQNEKPIVDELIKKHHPPGITLLNKEAFDEYINRIFEYRNPERIARISWNSNGWRFPSGPLGKSRNKETFEAQYGYGHEEWLFDKLRIIDGYHYAFLRPLMLKSDKHVGRFYNISLYTILHEKQKTKNLYVGSIKDVECISKEEAQRIYDLYKEKGWLQEMYNEVNEAHANSESFNNQPSSSFFNIRFRFANVSKPVELQEIDKNSIPTDRFKLLTKKLDYVIKSDPEPPPEGNTKSTKQQRITKSEYTRTLYHNKIQEAIRSLLKESYKSEYLSVHTEHNRVDIKARTHQGKWHFFEIKTNEPKDCIRYALGQIMEYTYRPNVRKAEKMIVVGDSIPDNDTQIYLQFLRNEFKIPIYYKCFNSEKNSLSQDY